MTRVVILLAALAMCVLAQNDCASCLASGKEWCPSTSKCHAISTCTGAITRPLNCPINVAPQFQYNETFARYTATPFMAAVYGKDDIVAQCITAAFPTAQMDSNFRTPCAKNQPDVSCHAYTAVYHGDRAIIVTFQGTVGNTQMADEIFSFFHEKADFYGKGKVYAYFYDAFFDIWNLGLEQQLMKLRILNPGYQLYVFGHSLGGSLASVFAAYAAVQGLWSGNNIKLITYGQPRTGDIDFATWQQSAIPYTHRIVHAVDPVPHMPPRFGPDGLFHHRAEVWYNNDMAIGDPYEVCPEADGDYCSNKIPDKDMVWSYHDYYYNISLETWADATDCTSMYPPYTKRK